MFLRFVMALCNRSPVLRRQLWRWWYQRLARKGPADAWTFMNYGCAWTGANALVLAPADEPNRTFIQLYHRVVAPVDLTARRVLEVGCGRGGGASYLSRYHHPEKMIAVDYSSEAIALCRRRHATVSNLEFMVGDAESLPFAAESFDAVVNVESSHCYGRVDQFFREVVRVLRPGGHFLFADARAAEGMRELDATLKAIPGWRLRESEDITADVVAALTADDARKRRLIAEIFPGARPKVFEEFAALAGTAMYQGFLTGGLLYRRWVWRKD